MCPAHHLRCHEFVFEDLLWMDTFTRVQAHYLIKQVDKIRVADPFITAEIETFLQNGHKIAKSRAE